MSNAYFTPFVMTSNRLGEYINAMIYVLSILLALAFGATVLALVVGVISFAIGGEFHKKHSNHLMRARVVFQGLTLALLALYALMIWAT